MKLLFVRHADPDYGHDSLTEVGFREAELLADYLVNVPADAYYVSCLGRARATAAPTLERLGRTAEICDWLQEFRGVANKPHAVEKPSRAWDWLPSELETDDRFFDPARWFEPDGYQGLFPEQEYARVCAALDELLAKHGYRRSGRFYSAENRNSETLVFFCHFAIECVLLSHLISSSPVTLWQGFCAAPSSITTVYTEEREEGIASFRIASFGETPHLTLAGEQPSFAARFCERWDDFTHRH